MLAIFILNIRPNVSVITCKSKVIGSDIPNCSPYDNHHKKSTCPARSPSNPPTTIPHKINNTNIHIFFL